MNTFLHFFISITLISFFLSCTNPIDPTNSSDLVDSGMTPTEVLNSLGDASQYYVMFTNATADPNTILLGIHGGPINYLITNYFEIYHNHFNVAYIHQVQTLTPDTYMSSNKLNTFEESKQYNIISAAYAYHVVKHFKDQGKTVYVMTHSIGSFIYPKTIEVYGNIADKLIITAGRLDIPNDFWQSFRDGYPVKYNTNGIDYEVSTNHLRDRELGSNLSPEEHVRAVNFIWNASRLQAGLGYTRYTQTLSDKNLGSMGNTNFMYVTGWLDDAIGRLSSGEISFLESKYVEVLQLTNDDHDLNSINTNADIVLNFLTND